MGIKIGIFLVGTLCSTLGSTIHVDPGNQPTHLSYVPVATSVPAERAARSSLSTQKSNSADESARRFPYGREIIEISDPTTDSTLHLPHYPPIDCTNKKECDALSGDTTPMPTFRPYSQEELNGFLKKYVEHNGQMPDNGQTEEPSNKLANIYMDETVNVLEGDKETGKSQEKSKSWQLMQAQAHKRPYDDRTGWVTLEPIPWSSSQVQKWEPNKRPPAIPQWNEDPPQSASTWNRPTASKWPEKPWNNKNTYEYKPSSKPWSGDKYNSKPSGWNSDSWGAGSDIITDDGPSFPHEPVMPTWYEKPTEVVYQGQKEHYGHPQTHPAEGDGRWVLLSSTKGYSVPHRSRAQQRSLFVTGKTPATGRVPSVKSHRSVRLTVLPPLNGTMNTTTIHGGLVEVEQTMQTVDEAHREHLAKMLKLESLKGEPPGSSSQKPAPVASKRTGTAIRIYPMQSPQTQARNNAMLAAVGAGMIPATVAMMLPMVLGRRRRSLDNIQRLAHLQLRPYLHHQ